MLDGNEGSQHVQPQHQAVLMGAGVVSIAAVCFDTGLLLSSLQGHEIAMPGTGT